MDVSCAMLAARASNRQCIVAGSAKSIQKQADHHRRHGHQRQSAMPKPREHALTHFAQHYGDRACLDTAVIVVGRIIRPLFFFHTALRAL